MLPVGGSASIKNSWRRSGEARGLKEDGKPAGGGKEKKRSKTVVYSMKPFMPLAPSAAQMASTPVQPPGTQEKNNKTLPRIR